MQKKVGIVTIDDSNNYGNRLQNFAMQEMLKSLGHEVFTIRVLPFRDLYYLWPENKRYCIKQYLYAIKPLRYIAHKLKKVNDCKNKVSQKDLKIKNQRIAAFERFNQTFIQYDAHIIRSQPLERRFYRGYDYLVAGSDQIWNPLFSWAKCVMYLRFVPEKKRIAIAASFGISEIPKEHRKIVKRYLNGMRYISVREESGKKIVKELTGRSCDLIMDPTLMIDIFAWNDILERAEAKLPQRYMAAYFLGDVSEEKKNCIENIARKKGCELVWMNAEEYEEIYNWGPENFLKVIHDCECFFTDSFHGCVFSILFHRQFFVFQREGNALKMFDRIDTLLSKLNLESQIVNLNPADDRIVEKKAIGEAQYAKADLVLEAERAKVREILKKVLS